MLTRSQAKSALRIFNVDPVKIGIVGLADLCAVEFRAADEQMDEVLWTIKPGERNQIEKALFGFIFDNKFLPP